MPPCPVSERRVRIKKSPLATRPAPLSHSPLAAGRWARGAGRRYGLDIRAHLLQRAVRRHRRHRLSVAPKRAGRTVRCLQLPALAAGSCRLAAGSWRGGLRRGETRRVRRVARCPLPAARWLLPIYGVVHGGRCTVHAWRRLRLRMQARTAARPPSAPNRLSSRGPERRAAVRRAPAGSAQRHRAASDGDSLPRRAAPGPVSPSSASRRPPRRLPLSLPSRAAGPGGGARRIPRAGALGRGRANNCSGARDRPRPASAKRRAVSAFSGVAACGCCGCCGGCSARVHACRGRQSSRVRTGGRRREGGGERGKGGREGEADPSAADADTQIGIYSAVGPRGRNASTAPRALRRALRARTRVSRRLLL